MSNARKGRTVEMVTRPVFVRAIEVLKFEWPRLEIHIVCGKGTYIRSMARDIGLALGTGGVLTGLRRTRIGSMRIEDAIALDDVPDPLPVARLRTLSPELLALIAPKGTQSAGEVCGSGRPDDSVAEDVDVEGDVGGVGGGDSDSGEE